MKLVATLLVSCAALALSILPVAFARPPWSKPRPSWSHHGPQGIHRGNGFDVDDFVKIEDLRFKTNNGVYYLTGLNYWACMNLAADDSAGGNHSRFITELDQMAAKGVNHLRIMASSEGSPTPQPSRMNPPLMLSPGRYNEAIFVGLDRCLAEMQKRGMRATMTLNDEWQWSGGFGQYVSWARENAEIPYPPSWNLSAPPQRSVPGTGWGNYTVTGVDASSWGNYTALANNMYTIPEAEQWYKDHINTVINRRNTVNGRLYKEDPTVMTWQLANEPQPAATPSQFFGPYSLELPPDPYDALIPWVGRISAYIKFLAPKQLVSVGFEGKQGEWYYKAVHNFSTVDYGTSHCWVQNWGVYDMLNSSQANLDAAKDFATQFIANTSQWALDIGKPVLLEEFGMARDNWENVDKDYLYLSSASTTHKDEYFRTIIGAVMESFRNGGGYVGTAPWAYGGLYRPETQRANEFGMVWAGDPPHEAPGWYDLYDTDEAMNIIREQQQAIADFLARPGRHNWEE
ncbi:hypothetical protein LTS18_000667 [Coniosporium uncinatum]|uniref:Uncharacterized protein n=1 Tax=Coniosporium uncinatum TaxID=93489 RepID=A0ACC3DYA1_9PEZI|nr:hypothetical protein LTS18_000667 [Coniosporium uncinatum]